MLLKKGLKLLLFSCLVVCVIVVFSGCDSQTALETELPGDSPSGNLTGNLNDQFNRKLEQTDLLGDPLQTVEAPDTYMLYGYDVLDSHYFNHFVVKYSYPILDEKKFDSKPDIHKYEDKRSMDTDFKITTESSISEFYKKLNASVDTKYRGVLFSGQASGTYGMEQSLKKNELITKGRVKHVTKIEWLHRPHENALKMLSKDFIKDLDEYILKENNVKAIFDRYGTHLITKALWGGRLDFNYRVTETSTLKKEKISTAVKASYSRVKGEVTSESEKLASELIKNSENTFESTGGDNIPASSIQDLFGTDIYENWVDSVKIRPQICGIPEGEWDNSMIPLWELVDGIKYIDWDEDEKVEWSEDDKNKIKERLEKYFNEQAEKLRIRLEGYDYKPPKYIVGIDVRYGDSTAKALSDLPPEYEVVRFLNTKSKEKADVNKNTGGKYIYICYVKGDKKEDAIADIRLGYGWDKVGSSWIVNKGYKKIGVDLNKGAGKKTGFVYLYYRRANDNDYLVLDEITAILDSDKYYLPEPWQWVYYGSITKRGDTNNATGARYIGLATRKQSFE